MGALTTTLPAAVVVGIDGTIGLQTSRILAARGVPVIGVAADRNHFCARTRVTRRIVTGPAHGEGLLQALERLGPQLPHPGVAFLLPCKDETVLTVSEHRQRLERWYRFVLPEHDVIALLVDKLRYAQHASSLGLPIPPYAVLRNRDDARRAAATLDFPIVVKPPFKTQRWRANAPAKAFRTEDAAQFLRLYEDINRWSDVLLAQSWIEGGEESLFNCNAYFGRDGQPLVTFVNRKIRQWPLETGQGSLGEEVRNDTVRDTAIRLFQSLGYRGLAHLEMKRDARSGELLIVESNTGRATNRATIAERGGVELLMTVYSDALELPLPLAREQRYIGVKWIDWRHDLQASAIRLKRRELTLRGWWKSVRGPSIEAVGSLRDPLPFVLDVSGALGRLARSSFGRVARRLRVGR